METANVVIDEASNSSFEKSSEEISQAILPSEPKIVQEEVDQEPVSPSTPSAIEVSTDILTSPEPKSHEEKEPSSRIKLNHPSEVIMGNMNELTLKSIQLINVLLTLRHIHAICCRLNPPRLRMPSRMNAGLRPCLMNCFSFKGMMSGHQYLDQNGGTSLAQSGYSAIKLMRKEM